MTHLPSFTSAFSLVELLFVLVLMAVFLLAAIPSWRSLVRKNQLSVDTQAILSALHFARAQAVMQGKRMRIQINGHYLSVYDKQAVLRTSSPLDAASDVQWIGGGDALSFMPSGSTAGQSGHYDYSIDGVVRRKIIVTMMGRIRVISAKATIQTNTSA